MDTSVLIRIMLGESPAAAVWFEQTRANNDDFYGSELLELETRRTVLNQAFRGGVASDMSVVDDYLAEFNLVRITPEILADAARLQVPLRAGDAIHIATMRTLADPSMRLVTHDAQMASSAAVLGLVALDPVTDDPNRPSVVAALTTETGREEVR
jgi:predicted nucleic acid-binding protein